jgi:hypothetical protein
MKLPAHEKRLLDQGVNADGHARSYRGMGRDILRLLDNAQRMRETLEALAADPDDVLPPDAYDQALQTRDIARQTLADLKRRG